MAGTSFAWKTKGEGVIALCAEDGSAHRVPATTIARALGDHSSMRLAVLNSCEGARASATDSFSSTGAGIMSAGLPAVVRLPRAPRPGRPPALAAGGVDARRGVAHVDRPAGDETAVVDHEHDLEGYL